MIIGTKLVNLSLKTLYIALSTTAFLVENLSLYQLQLKIAERIAYNTHIEPGFLPSGLLKKSRLLRRYAPRNDAKCVFRSLRAIRRIARQSQNVHFVLWQQAPSRE